MLSYNKVTDYICYKKHVNILLLMKTFTSFASQTSQGQIIGQTNQTSGQNNTQQAQQQLDQANQQMQQANQTQQQQQDNQSKQQQDPKMNEKLLNFTNAAILALNDDNTSPAQDNLVQIQNA